jgi:hypothetical protein
MEEIKELTSSSFSKELQDMAVSCIGLKENTAKKKVSEIMRKYDEIISYSKEEKEYDEIQLGRYRTLFDTLKSGRIYYRMDELKGYLLIRDIEQIEVSKKNVVVTLKTGREIKFSTDFEYLSELL